MREFNQNRANTETEGSSFGIFVTVVSFSFLLILSVLSSTMSFVGFRHSKAVKAII